MRTMSSNFLSPPREPSACTLFPYTTLFRSGCTLGRDAVVGSPDASVEDSSDEVTIVGRGSTVGAGVRLEDRKSTRLNSSHPSNSYPDFCLKKKNGKADHSRRS